MIRATAPGKIILFGEHAVVYGQPAIAVPVTQVQAVATAEAATHTGVLLRTPDFGQTIWLRDAPAWHPLGAAVRAFQAHPDAPALPPLTFTARSSIPIASGLGSGAAIAAAAIRALALFVGHEALARPAAVSAMTYEVERLHHGTPSGIDNTVVSYEQPVYFVRDLVTAAPDIRQRLSETGLVDLPAPVLETFTPRTPLHILIGQTGIPAPTKKSVGDVRRQWLATAAPFNALFAACGALAQQARQAIEQGDAPTLGRLMVENHRLLQEMTVSSPELDALVAAACEAGAWGAKLSGGGRGGNMIALVAVEQVAQVREALGRAGATAVLETVVR